MLPGSCDWKNAKAALATASGSSIGPKCCNCGNLHEHACRGWALLGHSRHKLLSLRFYAVGWPLHTHTQPSHLSPRYTIHASAYGVLSATCIQSVCSCASDHSCRVALCSLSVCPVRAFSFSGLPEAYCLHIYTYTHTPPPPHTHTHEHAQSDTQDDESASGQHSAVPCSEAGV